MSVVNQIDGSVITLGDGCQGMSSPRRSFWVNRAFPADKTRRCASINPDEYGVLAWVRFASLRVLARCRRRQPPARFDIVRVTLRVAA